jgi:hypothetical protein
MVLSLIFGKQKYAQSLFKYRFNGPAVVTFDTMVSEEHKFSSRITYFPVENGSIISDHIFKQPDVIILSGLISDTPLNIFAPSNRSIDAFNALVQLHERREVFDVITGIKVYKGMSITSLDVPRTIKTGQTLTFNITLQKIVFDDTLLQLRDDQNVFDGVQDNTPRDIVADNDKIPLFQSDPPLSLKDQASSAANVSAQSLEPVPAAVLPNVTTNAALIAGG